MSKEGELQWGAAGEQGGVGYFYHLYCWETTQTALEIVFC